MPVGHRDRQRFSPVSSSLASGAMKFGESVAGAGRLCPSSPTALRFNRYALCA